MSYMYWAWNELYREGQNRISSAGTSSSARRAVNKTKELEDRLDHLSILCMAMWSLIKEKTDLTEEELAQKVADIDLTDGELDGKVRKQPVECKNCGRTISPRNTRCLYCGQLRSDASAFDGV